MKVFGQSKLLSFTAPELTTPRMWFAMLAAAAVDATQFTLGWFGWFGADEVLDIIAMVLTSASIGFHPLLLPTFILEFVPVVGMLPTWTACTAAVIVLRRRTQSPSPASPPSSSSSSPPPGSSPIDVEAEVTRVPPKL